MVAARLYDVDGATQRLIARGVVRPLGVGAGPTEQVFQLHPQAWTVQPGHVLKLELLAQDSPYLRTPAGQQSVDGQRPAAAAAGRRRARARTSAALTRRAAGREVRSRPATSSPASTRPRRPAASAAPCPRRCRSRSALRRTFGAFPPGVGARVHGVHDGHRDLDRGRRDAARSERCPGRLINGAFSLAAAAARRSSRPGGVVRGPVSNDAVTVTFSQTIGATEPLRTGSYSKTLTFTLSTTNP